MAVELKTEVIPIRMTPTQADLIREVAEREGERASTWIRALALRHAKQIYAAQIQAA